MVIDKPQKVEIQKIDSMVVLIWPGDLMLTLNILFPQICCNVVIERNLFLNVLKKNPSIFNISASLKLLFFHFFRSLSDRVLKLSLLYSNFFSHF